MSRAGRRTFRTAAAILAVAALALSSPAAASAQKESEQGQVHLPGGFDGRAPVIPVTLSNASDFAFPESVHAGFVTFKVGSPDTTYHALQGIRVNPGHTLAQVLHDFELGLSDSRADNAQGAKQLVVDATLMGGVVTSSYAPMSVTMPMTPGTYYFFDQNDIGGPVPVRIHTLKVTGKMRWSGMPGFSSIIGMTINSEGMPAFVAPNNFDADGNILIYGQGDELHEAVFRSIKPGITDDYITQYYKDLDAGLPHAPSPWLDTQHGLQAMSPGQFAILHLDLPPGLYALVCLVPDDVTGLAHSHMGMHQVVTLH
jgi:hypothetical protein